MYSYDNRVVITLDAGGTNLVFGAMQANKFIVDPITLPSHAEDLDKCLATMVEGFRQVIDKLETKPVAISFAFPGPADYPNGIIGGYLPNFPSFREGVALGPFLEAKFGIPVFINNDGDLFAYGEALGGALPEVNARLEELGCPKKYKNLIGYTFGTGLGIGVVVNGRLNRGDNSCVETFCLKHKKMPDIIVEDGAAIRAVKRVYGELTGNPDHGLEPKDICDIADGKRDGDREAARKAFAEMGEIAGDAMATAVTRSLSATFITRTPCVERPNSEMPDTGVRTHTPSSDMIMISSSGATIFMAANRPFFSVMVMVNTPCPPRWCSGYSEMGVRLP